MSAALTVARAPTTCGSRTNTKIGMAKTRNSTGRQPEPVDDGDAQGEDEEPREDRPAVPDRGPDPGQLPARRRVAHHLERGVVIDERGLEPEVGHDEQGDPDDQRHVGDEERRADAQRGEEQQERHPAGAAVREGAQDRRDQGVDPDADRDRDRERQRPIALTEARVVGQVQADRGRDHDEREDGVGEVVQGPRERTTARPLGVRPARPRDVASRPPRPRDRPAPDRGARRRSSPADRSRSPPGRMAR